MIPVFIKQVFFFASIAKTFVSFVAKISFKHRDHRSFARRTQNKFIQCDFKYTDSIDF